MRDRIELHPRRTRRCRDGRDVGVILLGWAVVAGMGAPLLLGYLAVAAPGAFSSLFGTGAPARSCVAPACRPR